MKSKLCFILLIVIGTLAPVSTSAQGSFTLLIMRGGGLDVELEITDPALLGFFSLSDFPNTRLPAPPADPEGLLAQAYEITRYTGDSQTVEPVPYDKLRYMPGAANVPGLVFYDGLIAGTSEYDNAWFQADPAAEAVLEAILDRQSDQFQTWFEDRAGLVTVIGILLSVSVLLGWLRERISRRRHLGESG